MYPGEIAGRLAGQQQQQRQHSQQLPPGGLHSPRRSWNREEDREKLAQRNRRKTGNAP
jgi:hypothetical protein